MITIKHFDVFGMSCAACSARVEKAVLAVDGVKSCSVNLLTNSMSVDGDAKDDDIVSAVIKAGYDANLKGLKVNNEKKKDFNFNNILKRLISSGILLIILMYLSMGPMLFNIELPAFIEQNPLANALLQLLLSLSIMIINNKFFVSGFKSIMNRSPNMDALVSMGSGASFVYSTYSLFLMSNAYIKQDIVLAHTYMHDLYFESAAMILVLITLGKLLEEHSKGKTTNAIKSLMDLKPKTATIIVDGQEKVIPASEIKVGDIFIVKSGASIPTDGVIIDGFSAINESSLTGESIPVDKGIGSNVYAATINQSGYLKCKATKVGEDTSLSQIIKMVSDAASSKAPIAKVADKVSGVFVPVVILIALITTLIWLLAGEAFGFALSRGISVLVISCPCSLGLATPVAIMVGNGVGARNGILFKNAEALEQTGKIKTVALDKTGTITSGKPQVTDIIPLNNYNETDLLKIAYSLEKKSEHPLASAIINYAEDKNLSADDVKDFEVFPGNGISGKINDDIIWGGNLKFIEDKAIISNDVKEIAAKESNSGKTPLFFVKNEFVIGIICVADTIKDDSKNAITKLKNLGIKVIMLTGDNKQTANAVKEKVGVSEVVSDVLPQEKEKVISDFKKHSKIAMVGDGINDAPALTSADIGIAVGAGTDVAIDAADIVLMKDSLSDVVTAIKLSKKTLKNIHENLFWAFIYNIVGIPLAAGVLIPTFGIKLEPMFAAAAMSLSSFCVVLNALRLNFFKLNNEIEIKEKKVMEKTIKIEGMMCVHCEGRVKSALEAIDGVLEAIPDHNTNSALIKLSKEVSDDLLKKTVEEQGYNVI